MSLWPDSEQQPYGQATFGGHRRGPSLDDLRLVPPLHLPHRLDAIAQLGREPTPWDVDLATTLGGLPVSMPLLIPAMGSTKVAHGAGVELARAAGAAGVALVLGENIATVHGYSEPLGDGPTFKDRATAYLEACGDGPGGLAIQASVEDAMDELWWKIYTDPDFEQAIEHGRIAFEVKLGQGAKPGLGGITLAAPDDEERLGEEYTLAPQARPDGRRERFSAPGTFTLDILEAQVRHLCNDFPKIAIWVKIPGCREALAFADAAAKGGATLVTLDGAEAGTAFAPRVALDHLGLPTVALLARFRHAPPAIDVVLSGGLSHGADLVKAVALGCRGGAMGRQALQAAQQGRADAWFHDMAEELRHLVYAMGALDLDGLSADGIKALEPALAEALGVAWVYGSAPALMSPPPLADV